MGVAPGIGQLMVGTYTEAMVMSLEPAAKK